MKKQLLLLSLLIFLNSCGTELRKPNFYWNPKLISFVNEFKADAQKYGVTLPPDETVTVIDFGSSDEKYPEYKSSEDSDSGNLLGECTHLEIDTNNILTGKTKKVKWREILINPYYTNREHLKLTMYHEMGHCFLNKQHVNNPIEIMNPYDTDDQVMEDWDGALKRFFTNTDADE